MDNKFTTQGGIRKICPSGKILEFWKISDPLIDISPVEKYTANHVVVAENWRFTGDAIMSASGIVIGTNGPSWKNWRGLLGSTGL